MYTVIYILILLSGCAGRVDSSANNKQTIRNNNFADLNFLFKNQYTGRNLNKLTTEKKISEELSEKQKITLKDRLIFTRKIALSLNINQTRANIKRALLNKNYDELKNADIYLLINVAAALPARKFNEILEELPTLKSCNSTNLDFSIATLAERSFPDQKIFNKSFELYKKTFTCATGELKAKAAYRLAMFELLNENCKGALDYLGKVKASAEAKYLFSRAEYWNNYCSKAAKKNRRKVASVFYQAYPLSYHSILNFKNNDEDLSRFVFSENQIYVKLRTNKDADLNKLIEQVELAYANNKKNDMREYISWLSNEKLDSLEPEILLYLGYLSYLARDGLLTFQILAKTFVKDTNLKNKISLQLFYPKWYFAAVKKHAEQQQIDPLLIMALMRQESAFNSAAISRMGARGLMQIMPRTAKTIDKKLTKKDLLNPEKNIKIGTLYFSRLLKKYNNNVVFALAAYNAGHGVVDEWVERYKTTDQVLFADLIPYRETREYVGSILRNYYWYQSLEHGQNFKKNL